MNLRSVNWRRGDEGGEGMSISNYGAISGCGCHCMWAEIVSSSTLRCQGGFIMFYLVWSLKLFYSNTSSQLKVFFRDQLFYTEDFKVIY